MRFKTSLLKDPKHTDFVGCVGWNSTEEVYSCGSVNCTLLCYLVTSEVQL